MHCRCFREKYIYSYISSCQTDIKLDDKGLNFYYKMMININRPLNSARQKAANRWPVCTEWPPGSRRPLQAHHISCPERARELRREGSHRTCPTCFQWWIHYWSQSPLSLCSYQHPGASSQPADEDREWGQNKPVQVKRSWSDMWGAQLTLRSLWTILFWWQYCTADTIWKIHTHNHF